MFVCPMTVPSTMQHIREPEAVAIEAASENVFATDAQLLERFLRGDESGFAQLFRRHNQRLYNYCAKMLADDAAAEDIVQQVWERLLRACLDGEAIVKPLGYLIRAARNAALDRKKHSRFQIGIEEMSEAAHPRSTQPEMTHEEELVVAALDTLPKLTKEIVVLHYYSGYSFEEIAESLGKKPNAIWTRVSRARAQLKQEVERALRREERSNERHA